MKKLEILKNGIITENPVFVLLLGMCPTLGVTSSVESALGMGFSVVFVLLFSNVVVSAIRKIVPDEIRIPVYIVIIATGVTLLEMMLNAFVPALASSLGIFIPLIVVNCIILGRAESFASKNTILDSIFDALGMGLGFTLGITILASCREVLGAGTFLGITVIPSTYTVPIFIYPAGAFLALGLIIALLNAYRLNRAKAEGHKTKETKAKGVTA
ncbi:MAG TPA: electron transport complex subunit RsxE [Firmicutes bacterium]|nr:electron transport complex subunit RsxE [Bacillota bacterium]